MEKSKEKSFERSCWRVISEEEVGRSKERAPWAKSFVLEKKFSREDRVVFKKEIVRKITIRLVWEGGGLYQSGKVPEFYY